MRQFIPKSYLYLRSGYTFSTFKKDLFAGISVAMIALPLAMAFAIASGVDPARGLYTAIIAGFLISLLGGSRIQIGGPTGAFVVIVYDIIQRTGYSGLCVSTLIASFLLILLGLFRIGSFIKYIPHSLVTGFTTGIAVILFSTQIKDFFGLQMGTPPADFIAKWISYIHALPSLSSSTLLLSIGTLAMILFIRRKFPSIPWGLSVMILATGIALIFPIPVETILSRFGQIPRTLPIPSFSHITIDPTHLSAYLKDAITIAFLGGIESLLSAVIGDGMIGGRHKSNCELIAQGIANFGSILFGGIPATGAIARTATNIKTGAQTPVAGMIHAITLLLILLFLAPVVSQIPLFALSSVLMMIAWNMSEAPHFIKLLKGPLNDRLILLTSFLLTVFVDITLAISLGMILSCFLFMKQLTQTSKAVLLFPLPQDVLVYDIQGPLFFGTANILKDLLPKLPPKTCILRLHLSPLIDASGMHAIKEFHALCKKQGTKLYLSEIQPHAKREFKKFGLLEIIDEKHIFNTLNSAIENI